MSLGSGWELEHSEGFYDARVVEACTQIFGQNPYGQVSGGLVTLSAPVLKAELKIDTKSTITGPIHKHVLSVRSNKGGRPIKWTADVENGVVGSSLDVLCLVVRTELAGWDISEYMNCRLLVVVPSKSNQACMSALV